MARRDEQPVAARLLTRIQVESASSLCLADSFQFLAESGPGVITRND